MTDDVFTQKQLVRKKVKELKALCSAEEKLIKSNRLFSELENKQYFKDAKNIMCYWSMSDEVQTIDFIFKHMHTKQFFLPVVKGDILEVKMFEETEKMTSGEAFGISEPTGPILTDHSKLELIIVPGIAFDKNNNRLGRGKAYYDKLLLGLKVVKVGVCFDFQFFDHVPADETDIKMDDVIKG